MVPWKKEERLGCKKGPMRTCNKGAGSQAPAALRGLIMGLVSNPGVPEQLIGQSCYKNVESREGQCLKLWALLG